LSVPRFSKLIIPIIMIALLTACGGGGNSNTAPIGKIVSIQASNVLVGDVVFLDGSTSSDPEGNSLSYTWSFLSIPPDSETTLTDSFTDKPSFIVDKVGSYVAQLVVNNGHVDSVPEKATVIVVVPPPTVTILTPTPLSVATANPVTFTGTIDDPLATITVNGAVSTNNSGNFSVDITLAEGSNTVTIIATNNTGQVTITIDVVLKTLPGPKMTITSPGNNFFIGMTWDGVGASPVDDIPVKVTGTLNTTNGPPTVFVNNVVATIFPIVISSSYNFSVDILLSKGQQTITAIGTDSLGGSTTIGLNGDADYCVRGGVEAGVSAEFGNGQNNRCHEINGCNRNKFGFEGSSDTNALRNRPMPNAIFGLNDPVEFGSGYLAPEGQIDTRNDAFVHGLELKPADPLGCNIHDTCYQTCVPQGEPARENTWKACNQQQFNNHIRECRRVYPASCPFKITVFGRKVNDPVKCPLWFREKVLCTDIAGIYFFGVSTKKGKEIYLERQNDYCANP